MSISKHTITPTVPTVHPGSYGIVVPAGGGNIYSWHKRAVGYRFRAAVDTGRLRDGAPYYGNRVAEVTECLGRVGTSDGMPVYGYRVRLVSNEELEREEPWSNSRNLLTHPARPSGGGPTPRKRAL